MTDIDRRDFLTGVAAVSLAGILPESAGAAVIPPPPPSTVRSFGGKPAGNLVACFTRGESMGAGSNGGVNVTGSTATYTINAGTLTSTGGTSTTTDGIATGAIGCDGRFSLRNYAGMSDVAGFKIAFANWTFGNSAYPTAAGYELPGSNAVTLTASLEYPYIYSGTQTTIGSTTNTNIVQPITFNGGALSVVIQPGETAWTDFIPQYIHASNVTAPLVRWHLSVASGGSWPRGMLPSVTINEGCNEEVSGAVVDETLVGTFYPSSSASYYSTGYQFGPLAVVGNPVRPQPSVLVVGDSLSWGQGDDQYGVAGNGNYSGTPTGDGYGAKGPVERALSQVTGGTLTGAGYGHIKITKSGITAQQLSSFGTLVVGNNLLLTPQLRWRELAQYCTNAIVLLGTNDISQANGMVNGGFGSLSSFSTTSTAVPGAYQIFYLYLAEIYQSLAAAGCRVFACTIPPNAVTQNPVGSVTGTIYGQPAPGRIDGSQLWPFMKLSVGSGGVAAGSTTMTLSGTLTSTSALVANPGLTLGMQAVYPINGMPQNTHIVGATAGSNVVTLSQATTGTIAANTVFYVGDNDSQGAATTACSMWNPRHPNGRTMLNSLIANAPNDPALKGSVYGVIDVGRAAGIDDGTGRWVYNSVSSTLNATIDGTHWQWGAGAASNGIPLAQAVFARAISSGMFIS